MRAAYGLVLMAAALLAGGCNSCFEHIAWDLLDPHPHHHHHHDDHCDD